MFSVVPEPGTQKVIEKVGKFIDMGHDSVLIHQAGPDRETFTNLAHETILPGFGIKPPRVESKGRMVPGHAR